MSSANTGGKEKNKHHTEPLIVRKINEVFGSIFTVLLVGQKEKEVNKKCLW